jgi:hypothetical protein
MPQLPKVPDSPAEARAQIEAALVSLHKIDTEGATQFFEGMKGLMLLSESLRKEGADLSRMRTQTDQLRAISARPGITDLAKRLSETLVSENEAIIALGSRFDRVATDLDEVIQKLRELRRAEMDRVRDYLVHAAELLPLVNPDKK